MAAKLGRFHAGARIGGRQRRRLVGGPLRQVELVAEAGAPVPERREPERACVKA